MRRWAVMVPPLTSLKKWLFTSALLRDHAKMGHHHFLDLIEGQHRLCGHCIGGCILVGGLCQRYIAPCSISWQSSHRISSPCLVPLWQCHCLSNGPATSLFGSAPPRYPGVTSWSPSMAWTGYQTDDFASLFQSSPILFLSFNWGVWAKGRGCHERTCNLEAPDPTQSQGGECGINHMAPCDTCSHWMRQGSIACNQNGVVYLLWIAHIHASHRMGSCSPPLTAIPVIAWLCMTDWVRGRWA